VAKFAKIAVPAARSTASVLAVRRRIILGALIGAIVLSILSIFLAGRGGQTIISGGGGLSATTAFAREIATDYLNGVPTSVPVASGVDASFGLAGDVVQRFQWSSLELSGTSSIDVSDVSKSVTLVSFFVRIASPVSEEGEAAPSRLFSLTIPMVSPSGSFPRLGALPTLMPVDFVDGSNSATGIPVNAFSVNASGDEVSAEVVKVISDWAVAFVQGGYDDQVLKRITGDTDPESIYSGLGGWQLNDLAINGLVSPPVQGDSPGVGYVVRVTLALTPPAGTGPTTETEYDVWVAQESAGQANPPVIAWGAAGTAQNMSPLQNAVNP
jgi:hypothetical protein